MTDALLDNLTRALGDAYTIERELTGGGMSRVFVAREHALDSRCAVLFSPVHGALAPRDLAEWILADRLPVRFQLQLHKLLWDDARGK